MTGATKPMEEVTNEKRHVRIYKKRNEKFFLVFLLAYNSWYC